MNKMTLQNIAAACGGEYIGDPMLLTKRAFGVTIDSRKVELGFMFIATVGERVDGHDFIPLAFEKGALCVISEKKLENPAGPYILVTSSFQALKDIAKFYRENLSIKVVGITGSVGKTSTKEVIASVLSRKYKVLKTQGNFNNEVGLPLTILNIREEHQVAVLEMGISDFGEMERLSDIAKPDVCVITNIGLCHLENLKTQNGILQAKTEMFEHMNPAGDIIINGDDKYLATIKKVRGIVPKTFGYDKMNTLSISNVENLGLDGSKFEIHEGLTKYNAEVLLPGSHMIINAAAAALVGKVLGLSQEQIIEGIRNVEAVDGRSNLIHTGFVTIIDDCYNANPVSMKSSIELLSMANTRKVAILGDMFELGENENRLHESVGIYAGEKQIDLVLCVGERSQYIYQGALKNLEKERVLHFKNKEDLMKELPNLIKKGDSILVKASHGMQFTEIVEELKNSLLVTQSK